MSDTPETDARTYIPLIGASTVPSEFARKLERERDEARELLAKALVRGDLALAETKKAKEELFWSDYQDKREMQRERDEALMDRANGDMATMTRNHYERLIKERDEAREALRELWQTADAYIPQIDEEQTTKWHNAMALHTTLQKVK
jgi:hypothetical protein